MRQLLIQLPAEYRAHVVAVAQRHQAKNLVSLVVEDDPAGRRLIVLELPNASVESLVSELDGIPELHVSWHPEGVMSLAPPTDQVPAHVMRVQHLSPLEVYLSGLQSVGGWGGFLGYAVAAGILAWVGLYTDTVFLLTAAMLVAPFGSPAMNLAIATARGDGPLAVRSLVRYTVALAAAVATAYLLSLLVGQVTTTTQMTAISNVSSVAFLLPLVAGAAGALSQAQSQRASLVSGAAVGMLVAASLAPPAALIGMASALREWEMAKAGLFVLVLQLAGINLAGATVFRCFGLHARGAQYDRGRPWITRVAAGLSAIAFAGLLMWQFWHPTTLRQGTAALQASGIIQEVVSRAPTAELVEAHVRFPRRPAGTARTLFCQVFVLRHGETGSDALKPQLERLIQSRLLAAGLAEMVLVDVTVLTARSTSAVSAPAVPGSLP